MTTGNAPALPATDDNAPPATNEPASPGLTFTSPQPSEDADDVALNAVLAEAQAEEANGQQGEQLATTTQDPATPASPAAAAPAAAAQGQPQQQQANAPVMVPIERVNELSNKLEQQRLENARLQGMLEVARPAPGQPGQHGAAPPPPQQTPAQRLAAIDTASDALAARFDNGEITMAEFKREERKLTNDAQAIREEQLTAKLQPAAAAPSDNDSLYLETLTQQLENTHQWVKSFDKVATESEWDFVASKARENLAARNVDLSKKGAMSQYELRREISTLIDQYAPMLIADRAQLAASKGVPFPGQAPQAAKPAAPVPGQPRPLSPAANGRLQALQTAAGAPPDITALNGNNGDPGGMPTDAAVEFMSEKDFDALPDAVSRRLRGL